jgi:prevent-host-death family protein
MKEISIKDLKRNLSAVLQDAAAGTPVVITFHNKPLARLGPVEPAEVHRGSSFGKARLRPLLRAKTRGRYLSLLIEDRKGEGPSRANPS